MKKVYKRPQMTVILLNNRQQLLAGSNQELGAPRYPGYFDEDEEVEE